MTTKILPHPTENDIARFWTKVAKRGPDDCWEWLAYCSQPGYGQFRFRGEIWPAHRFVWAIEHGQISTDLFIRHACGSRSCVNPAHLILNSFPESAVRRFWPKVRKLGPDECWEWAAAKSG
jgi:hypothetical protein